jgi:ribosome-associated toxin RatA of RatAB toxin-antitoxin module
MFKKILIGLALVIAIFLVVVAMQPAEFRVERKALVAAPPEITFDQVNDFKNWPSWSPWAKLDPSMESSLSEVSAGTGATYAWKGNKKVGEGRMTITESRPAEYLAINLEFLKPFKATNLTEFTFKPIHGGTMVVWSMSGKNNFISKAVCMFMDMDKMVGGDFEKGLADIKKNAEIASGWRKPDAAQ